MALPFRPTSLLGLDIGSDSIKIVETEYSKTGFEVVTYGISKHSADLKGYWDGRNLREIASTIESILEAGGFTANRTVVSVPSTEVYVTIMDFEASQSKKQIAAEINRQAQYFLPYPPDEMRMSWGLLEDHKNVSKYTGKQRVLINATPDFVIENSKHLLEHINLDGVALENQTLSQIRSVLNPDIGFTILVDIGHRQTTFSIVSDGDLRSSSHILEGSAKVSQEFSDKLGVEFPIAEYFKKDLSLVNLLDIPNPIESFYRILKQELGTFYDLNKRIAQDAKKVVITGASTNLPGIKEFFHDFPIPIYLGNPLRMVKISEEMKPYIHSEANQLSTAIGLAMREDLVWS